MHQVDANTVALWRLDEASGVLADQVGDYPLTATGTAVVTGRFGSAREFAGAGSLEAVVDATLRTLFQSGDWTLEWWMAVTAGIPSTGSIFSMAEDTGVAQADGALVDVRISSTETLTLRWNNGPSSSQTATPDISAPAPGNGSWNHFAITRDGRTVEFFFNGESIGGSTVSADPVAAATQKFRIGRSGSTAPIFLTNSRLDDIRLSNVVRSAAEIRANAHGNPDTTAPAVTLQSPAEGAIDSDQALAIRATDAAGLRAVALFATLPSGQPEWIYDGDEFSAPYEGSTRQDTLDAGGNIIQSDFAVTRSGDWPVGALEVEAKAWDAAGNEASDTFAFTVADGAGSHLEAVRAALLADVAVTALVADRVYPLQAPQNPTLPFLVLTQVSDVPASTFTGAPAGLLSAVRMQVDAYAERYAEAHELAAAVDDCLGALSGTPISAIRENTTDSRDDGTELYRAGGDYLVARER